MKYYSVDGDRALVREPDKYRLPEIWQKGDTWKQDVRNTVNLDTDGYEITAEQAEELKQKLAPSVK